MLYEFTSSYYLSLLVLFYVSYYRASTIKIEHNKPTLESAVLARVSEASYVIAFDTCLWSLKHLR